MIGGQSRALPAWRWNKRVSMEQHSFKAAPGGYWLPACWLPPWLAAPAHRPATSRACRSESRSAACRSTVATPTTAGPWRWRQCCRSRGRLLRRACWISRSTCLRAPKRWIPLFPVWRGTTVGWYPLDKQLDALLTQVAAGNPVLLRYEDGSAWWSEPRYAVLMGYDRYKQRVLLRSGMHRRQVMAFDEFASAWEKQGVGRCWCSHLGNCRPRLIASGGCMLRMNWPRPGKRLRRSRRSIA